MSDPSPDVPAGESSSPFSAGIHQAARLDKLSKIEQLGVDPWGGRLDGRSWIEAARQQGDKLFYRLEDGRQLALPEQLGDPDFNFKQWKVEQGSGAVCGPQLKVAGRIVLMRPTGKLIFLNLRDWTGDIQIYVGQRQIGEELFRLAKLLDLGDWISVEGQLGRTDKGELTIFADSLTLQCKSLEPPPEKHHGLTDPELRQRQRYLDLVYNPGVKETFLKRTAIVQSIRKTLDDHQFCEVEGPTLQPIAGGAAARPFITHHNALDMQLYLRIALELHLKRLMVGGLERVYELGRVYRNEGISPRHNPEFTMLECYQAFGDYSTMMDLTEQLIGNALQRIGQGNLVQWEGETIDFSPPFARRSYDDLLAEYTEVDPKQPESLERAAKRFGIDPAGKHPDVIKSELFESQVEHRLTGPVFVIDYPSSLCPLTRRRTDRPELAERFELFVQGMELANAYTELNDPLLQEQLFRTQLAGLPEEESMAKLDLDFLLAMRHGMPPAGGLGIGIDRLVMLLTGSRSIREVILFPVLRP
jgi:lysyl-tRNA synthetase class 2